LNTIRSRRIDPNIVLDRGPHVLRSLWMALFSDDKVTPLTVEGCVGASESRRGVKPIEVDLLVKALEGGAEYASGMEVDASIRGTKAEDVFVVELLGTSTKAIHHRAVHIGGELRLRGHSTTFMRVSRA
jgi:hypothetical protein